MINPNPAKPDAKAAILVYGRQTPEGLPQAAWFRIEDRQTVKAAAAELKLTVIELQSDAERALVAGVHEGVLKGSGRMIVGTVDLETYRRIEEYGRKGTGSAPTTKADSGASAGAKASGDDKVGGAGSAPSSSAANASGTGSSPAAAHVTAGPAAVAAAKTEPNASSGGSPGALPDSVGGPPSPTLPWALLRAGDSVLAAYWNEKREPEGWWLATIARIEKNELVLRWPDAPEYPVFKRAPKYIAILHPEFIASEK